MTTPLRKCFSFIATFPLLCLFVTAATSNALSQPCDNTSAPNYSAVHLNSDGNIWTPDDIQNNASLRSTLFQHRITKSAIVSCLELNHPIRNHVIDFLDYLEAARAADSEIRSSNIEQSIMWDFQEEESVTLSLLVGRLPKPDLGIPFRSGPLTDKKYPGRTLLLDRSLKPNAPGSASEPGSPALFFRTKRHLEEPASSHVPAFEGLYFQERRASPKLNFTTALCSIVRSFPTPQHEHSAFLPAGQRAHLVAGKPERSVSGFDFAEDYDVGRKFRVTCLYRVAPVLNDLTFAYPRASVAPAHPPASSAARSPSHPAGRRS